VHRCGAGARCPVQRSSPRTARRSLTFLSMDVFVGGGFLLLWSPWQARAVALSFPHVPELNSCHLRNGANWVFGSPEAGWPSPARHTAWHSRSEAAAPPTTTPCRPVTSARRLSPDGEDFGWPRPFPSSPDLGRGTTHPDPPARPPRTRTPAATGS
jgi:hypothetical protein